MIPQTVPNKPTKGAVEPTVARKAIKRSTRSISRPTVTLITRSMRCCRLVRIPGVPRRFFAALRRLPQPTYPDHLIEDDRPGPKRGKQQDQHHQFDNRIGLDE